MDTRDKTEKEGFFTILGREKEQGRSRYEDERGGDKM
jgi:hypothetical protein